MTILKIMSIKLKLVKNKLNFLKLLFSRRFLLIKNKKFSAFKYLFYLVSLIKIVSHIITSQLAQHFSDRFIIIHGIESIKIIKADSISIQVIICV